MHRYDPEQSNNGTRADVDAEVLERARKVARSKIAFHAGSVYFGDGFLQRLEDREVERMTRRRSD